MIRLVITLICTFCIFNIIFIFIFIVKSSDRLWILRATRTALLGDALAALKRAKLLWIWKV